MIDFSKYTRERIQADMLSRVSDTIDKRQGSIIQTAVGPAAWYLEGMYLLLEQVQQNAYAGTAVGSSLEYIAEERNIHRKEATSAARKGTVDVEIPKGTKFKTINGGNSVIFVSGDLIDKEGGKFIYEMVCEKPGIIGNAYSGPILPITVVNGLTEASIGEIILSGSDEEDDDSLRARYFATFDIAAFGGNIASYRTAILAIAGVGAVQIYPAWKGGGTVLCSILNSQLKPADQELIRQTQNYICPSETGGNLPSPNGYGLAPIGAAVTITTPSALKLNITCNIQLAKGASTSEDIYKDRIKEKIETYLGSVRKAWGNPIKGQKIEYSVAVYISQISVAILDIEEIVNVTDITINGSSKDLILIETAELQQIPELEEVKANVS